MTWPTHPGQWSPLILMASSNPMAAMVVSVEFPIDKALFGQTIVHPVLVDVISGFGPVQLKMSLYFCSVSGVNVKPVHWKGNGFDS